MKKYILLFSFLSFTASTFAQQKTVSFQSSDAALQTAFERAKKMALSYKGQAADPAGAWYESSLPPRSAFCMRDVSHQSIAAEILGLSEANKNMMNIFVKNISKSKDWCSYWEVNKLGKPAVEDYRNDTAFWYNLNANFDILAASWKLYLWTGDETYIQSQEFRNFHQKSTDEFIKTWVLQVDSLLSRPSHPREHTGYDRKDAFHEYRGLPSYSEGVPQVKMGVDLIASIYRGLLSHAAMLRLDHKPEAAEVYEKKALAYQQHIEKHWWDEKTPLYNTHYTENGSFGKGEGEIFLLWFDVLEDSIRIRKTVEHLLSKEWNVENLSYLPYQLYRYGYSKEAYDYMLLLTNPDTKRREYPEVSFGVIHAMVQGLMGIEVDAHSGTLSTQFRGVPTTTARLLGLPLLKGSVDVIHEGIMVTCVKNTGNKQLVWNARFNGTHKEAKVGGKLTKMLQQKGDLGQVYSYCAVKLQPGQEVTVTTDL